MLDAAAVGSYWNLGLALGLLDQTAGCCCLLLCSPLTKDFPNSPRYCQKWHYWKSPRWGSTCPGSVRSKQLSLHQSYSYELKSSEEVYLIFWWVYCWWKCCSNLNRMRDIDSAFGWSLICTWWSSFTVRGWVSWLQSSAAGAAALNTSRETRTEAKCSTNMVDSSWWLTLPFRNDASEIYRQAVKQHLLWIRVMQWQPDVWFALECEAAGNSGTSHFAIFCWQHKQTRYKVQGTTSAYHTGL